MNPILIEMLAKQRHEDLMREAAQMQLSALARSDQPSRVSRFLAVIGDALIRLGNRLKQGHERKVGLSAR